MSEANKKKCEQVPGRHVPQYGGFCAFGVAVGAKFDADPRLFKVVEGRLYLNLNEDIQKNFQRSFIVVALAHRLAVAPRQSITDPLAS